MNVGDRVKIKGTAYAGAPGEIVVIDEEDSLNQVLVQLDEYEEAIWISFDELVAA